MTARQEQFNIVYITRGSSSHPSEGLNVLLSDLIKPLADSGVQVFVHTTDRHEGSLTRALKANGVKEHAITVVRHRVGSILLGYLSRTTKERKGGRLQKLIKGVKNAARSFVTTLADLSGWAADMTWGTFVFKAPIALVMSLVFLVAAGIFALFAAIGVFFGSALLTIYLTAMRAYQRVHGSTFWGKARLKAIMLRLRKFRWNLVIDLVNNVYRREQLRLAAAINRKKSIPFLFVPWSFDGALVSKLRAKKVIVFPDAVTTLFPLRFPSDHILPTLNGMKESLSHADGVICYSEFVRDVQLSRFKESMNPEAAVRVIPQGYFQIPEQPIPKHVAHSRLNAERGRAKNLFPRLMGAPVVPDFSAFQYILYPTIDRPHKNTLVLAKALNILIRERYRNVKLVLTSPALTRDVESYIHDRRLHRDVIVMPSVPLHVLDTLCAGAAVMVHPSFAEGGDIFNFSRAVSQGSPALLANIPVVREMFERENIDVQTYGPWLFEPTDDISLADKIESLLDDSAPMKREQSAILARLGEYDFAAMAQRYHEFCKEIANEH